VYDGTAFVDTPVFGRTALRPGDAFDGPAVIEQYDATTYVGPGWHARIDGFGNLVMER
jgi:N-methylhydantoinase A